MKRFGTIVAALVVSSSFAFADDQKPAGVSHLIGMPKPVFETLTTLPHQHVVGAMNLCAHAVQVAAEKGAITKDSVPSKLHLCGQGRFDDVHRLIAEPEPTAFYRHPMTGEHHVVPKWLLHVHGLPEGAVHVEHNE